jgi:transposase
MLIDRLGAGHAMRSRFLTLPPQTRQKLLRLKQETEHSGCYRVARRLHAVLLNADGHTSGQIAALLDAPRSRVSVWLRSYEQDGWAGLQEGAHTGRPPALDSLDRHLLADIVDSGPVAYGFLSGVWTCPMVVRVIEEEFGIHYHAGHVCRLLHDLEFSVQRPKRLLAGADPTEQARWRQHVYPGIKASCQSGAALVFEDEASFRQDSTLHQTWARRGRQPRVLNTGERKSVKVFGCVEVYSARFLFHYEPVFNAQTYLRFLEQVARAYYPRQLHYIHDRASYHRDQQVADWFREHRPWWHSHVLPKCSPEDNAAEPLWRHVRLHGTHNRYFEHVFILWDTLTRLFRSMQRAPAQIRGYLSPFQ